MLLLSFLAAPLPLCVWFGHLGRVETWVTSAINKNFHKLKKTPIICKRFSLYTNKVLTEFELYILWMVSPRSSATDRTVTFSDRFAFSASGIVLVTTSLSMGDSSIRSIAGPDKTG